MGVCGSKDVSKAKSTSHDKELPDDIVFKLLLVGDAGVGKTSIVSRFVKGSVSEEDIAAVEGVDTPHNKEIVADGTEMRLQVWDTAGQEKFRTITSSYYRGAHGIVIVYDITNKETFKNVKHWTRDVELYAAESVIRFVVGNKADLDSQRQVKKEEGRALADDLGVGFFEVSAKEGTGVSEAISQLSVQIRDRILSEGVHESPHS